MKLLLHRVILQCRQENIEDRIKLIERLNAREKLKEAEKILSQKETSRPLEQ